MICLGNPNPTDSGSIVSEDVIPNGIHNGFEDEIHQVHMGEKRSSCYFKFQVLRRSDDQSIESSRVINSTDQYGIGMRDKTAAEIYPNFDDIKVHESGGIFLLLKSVLESERCIETTFSKTQLQIMWSNK
ncbi:hypothetical protein QAD02_021854 [Eretmocerus hayati]|uniref:Uncharacterized protein n=1 Tax=Eretmocerus hayati TaxID=131215 RepID=A0ACC2PRC5_9HYME|nr:hypothetical protein QAD02_021854 [Eretmocerus hayati]